MPGWLKSFRPSTKVSPEPVTPVIQLHTPQPALPPLKNSFVTSKQEYSTLASAHATNARNHLSAGAQGSVQSIRYGAQQSYYHSGQAMQQFRQGNVGQGFVQMGNAAYKGAGGIAYSAVPMAKGLGQSTLASVNAARYRLKQWTAPAGWSSSNAVGLQRQAAVLRQKPQGYLHPNRVTQGTPGKLVPQATSPTAILPPRPVAIPETPLNSPVLPQAGPVTEVAGSVAATPAKTQEFNFALPKYSMPPITWNQGRPLSKIDEHPQY